MECPWKCHEWDYPGKEIPCCSHKEPIVGEVISASFFAAKFSGEYRGKMRIPAGGKIKALILKEGDDFVSHVHPAKIFQQKEIPDRRKAVAATKKKRSKSS